MQFCILVRVSGRSLNILLSGRTQLLDEAATPLMTSQLLHSHRELLKMSEYYRYDRYGDDRYIYKGNDSSFRNSLFSVQGVKSAVWVLKKMSLSVRTKQADVIISSFRSQLFIQDLLETLLRHYNKDISPLSRNCLTAQL